MAKNLKCIPMADKTPIIYNRLEKCYAILRDVSVSFSYGLTKCMVSGFFFNVIWKLKK